MSFSAPAIRDGDIYCAPWCGAGCTWDDYQRSARKAHALALRLGDGWKGEVWENLGWHWCATFRFPGGCATLGPTGDGRFHCLIGESKGAGHSAWSRTGNFGEDPVKVARAEAKAALEVARRLLALAEAAARGCGVDLAEEES